MAQGSRVLSSAAVEPLIQRAFRLSEEDSETLDVIRARHNLPSRTAALRFLLRWWKAKVS